MYPSLSVCETERKDNEATDYNSVLKRSQCLTREGSNEFHYFVCDADLSCDSI